MRFKPYTFEQIQAWVIGFTFILAILIVAASVAVWLAWQRLPELAVPELSQFHGDTKSYTDACQAYATLITTRHKALTDIYEVVVLKGLLVLFTALVTGIVAVVILPRVTEIVQTLTDNLKK